MTRSPARVSAPYLVSARARHVAALALDCLPERIDGLVEPYLDSGGMALGVLLRHPDAAATLASRDEELVLAWEVARWQPDALIEAVARHAERHRPPYFAAVRDEDPTGLDDVARASRFAYLRGTAAPGPGGEPARRLADVRMGRDVLAVDPAGIRALARFLADHDVTFSTRSPFELLPVVREDDIVLLDPPFGDASEGGGGAGFEREVRGFVNTVTARGALVLAPSPDWAGSGAADAELYRGWPGMAPVNELEGGERLWGSGALQRRLRAERRDG